MSMGSRILVTGANGTIGRAFLSILSQSKSHKVKAQVRNKRQTRASIGDVIDLTKIELLEADFTMCLDQDYDKLVKDTDTVIHAGGLVHNPNASYQEFDVVNTRATLALAQACDRANVANFIFLSTAGVYGNGPFINCDENFPLNPITPYASSKAACERVLADFADKFSKLLVFRLGLVYGPGDRGNVLALIKEVKNNRYLHIGKGDTQKSMIYSEDAAKILLDSLKVSVSGFNIFNLANPNPVSIKELTEEIASILKTNKKIQSLPEPLISLGVKAAQALLKEKSPVSLDQLKKLTTTTTLSCEKLLKLSPFTPETTLLEGLTKEIDWAKEQNLL